ncbi:hypothetical protein RJ41_15040, partial [Alteromonas marina]
MRFLIYVFQTSLTILLSALITNNAFGAGIEEVSITASDSNTYTIPRYVYSADELPTDHSIPYKDFYIKVNGVKTYNVSRSISAELYEASLVSSKLHYFNENMERLDDTEFRSEVENYLDEINRRELQSTGGKWLSFGFVIGSLVVGGLFCSTFLGCFIVGGITATAGVGDFVLSTYSESELRNKFIVHYNLAVDSYNNFDDFRNSEDYGQFDVITTKLSQKDTVSIDDLATAQKNADVVNLYLYLLQRSVSELPTIEEVDVNRIFVMGGINVLSASISGPYDEIFSAAVNGMLLAYNTAANHKEVNGVDIPAEELERILEEALEIRNSSEFALTYYFDEERINLHSLQLFQFVAEGKRKVTSSKSFSQPTSEGSQIRLRFDNFPPGKLLKIRNNIKTWEYTIPESGQLFAIIAAGSDQSGLKYQVVGEDDEIIIAEKTINVAIQDSSVKGLSLSPDFNSSNDTHRIFAKFTGYPSGFNGILFCIGKSQNISFTERKLYSLPTTNDSCGQGEVLGNLHSSSRVKSIIASALDAGEVYYVSATPYKLIPQQEDSDGNITAAYYELGDEVFASTRTYLTGYLQKTKLEPTILHPYVVINELIVPGPDEYVWHDNAQFSEVTIPKNTTILFTPSARLTVYGNINAVTSKDYTKDPIIFGAAVSKPTKGNWANIHFRDGSSGLLDGVQIEHGGNLSGALILDGSPEISRSKITHSSTSGILIRQNSQASMFLTTSINNSRYGIEAPNSGNYAATNSYKVYFGLFEGDVGDAFLGYAGSGSESTFPTLEKNNRLNGSRTANSIALTNYALNGEMSPNDDLYILGSFTIDESGALTLKQGRNIYFKDRSSRLLVKGKLKVDGRPTNQVTFTSIKSAPSLGDWGYVR